MSTTLTATTCKNKITQCYQLALESEINFNTFPPGNYWLQEIQHIQIYNDVTD